MKACLVLGLLLLTLAVAPQPTVAATANFQANCTFGSLPIFCVFDARRSGNGLPATSCAPASVSQYFWDFGDGGFLFTTNPVASHSYTQHYCEFDFVTLAVFCSDNTSATITHCYCSTLGFGGCIRPGAGWTP